MATFVPTVTSDTNRKGVAFANNTGTISANSTLDIVNDFTLSYAIKQLSSDTAHFCKGEPEDPSIASGMIYTESKGKRLRVVIFDVNGTNVLSVITNNRVLASNKSKVIQIRYKQSTDLLEIFIDGVQVYYNIETSQPYYHATVSALTGIDTNASNMTFGSASGKNDFDGILYGGIFDLEYLSNTNLNTIYEILKDVSVNNTYQQIVFVSNRSGSYKIHQMTEDGNDEFVLNNSFTTPQFLKYKKSSDKIAVSEGSGTNIVKVIDSEGNVLSNPTPTNISSQWGSHALNNSNIFVYTEQNGSDREIYYSDNGATPVATGIISNVLISPQITLDGNYLIYSDLSANKIKRVDFPSLANPTVLYSAPFNLYNCVLSRDGNYIGFTQIDATGYYQVFKMGIGGASPVQLTTGLTSKYFYDFNDDSTKIVYGESNGLIQIKVMNSDGTNIQNISNNSYNEFWACFKPLV